MAWYQANGNNLKRTARQWEIPVATLQHWVYNQHGINDGVRKRIPKKRKELHELFEAECRAALQSAEEIRESAPYGTLMMAAGLAAEKMRLLREQPTAINQNLNINADDDTILAIAETIRFKRLIGDVGEGSPAGVCEGYISEV